MYLDKNTDLYSPGYRTIYRRHYPDGTFRDEYGPERTRESICVYQGAVQSGGRVAASLCEGTIKATLLLNGEVWSVEPAAEHLSSKEIVGLLAQKNWTGSPAAARAAQLHVLFKAEMSELPFCGVVASAESKYTETQKRRGAKSTQASVKYIELLIVNDFARFDKYFKVFTAATYRAKLEGDTEQVVNAAQVFYDNAQLSIRVQLSLAAQMTWTTADPYSVTLVNGEVDFDMLLRLFLAWRLQAGNTPAHDNAHLFSGLDFKGSTLGFAYVDSMCSPPYSGGIEQLTDTRLSMQSAIFAHELGHNLGMQHDGSTFNTCPDMGFIMNSAINLDSPPSAFSTCSQDYYRAFMINFITTCLDNTPKSQWGDPVCGDGRVQQGEDCDCGQADCSLTFDPCCNGTTCKLVAGATCSAKDGCCNNCHIVSDNTTICRAAQNSCDYAERCDGVSAKCPDDEFKGSGTGCSEQYFGAGLCYQGFCSSFARSCREIGSKYTGGPYDACPSDRVARLNGARGQCDVLWCTNGAGSCVSFQTYGDVTLKVQEGVPCDTNMQCSGGKCLASEQLNSNFAWQAQSWLPCMACGDPQSRSIKCVRAKTSAEVSEELCSPTSKPVLSRLCLNDTLGCVYDPDGPDYVYVLGWSVQKTHLILLCLGGFAFCCAGVAVLVHAVTHGPHSFERVLRERARTKTQQESVAPQPSQNGSGGEPPKNDQPPAGNRWRKEDLLVRHQSRPLGPEEAKERRAHRRSRSGEGLQRVLTQHSGGLRQGPDELRRARSNSSRMPDEPPQLQKGDSGSRPPHTASKGGSSRMPDGSPQLQKGGSGSRPPHTASKGESSRVPDASPQLQKGESGSRSPRTASKGDSGGDSARRPDTGSQRPETGGRPGTNSRQPDTSSRRPDGVQRVGTIHTQFQRMGSRRPSTGPESRLDGSQHDSSRGPDSARPHTGARDASGRPRTDSNRRPDTGAQRAESTSKRPEAAAAAPPRVDTFRRPDAGAPRGVSSSGRSDAGVQRSDDSARRPDTGSRRNESRRPDTGAQGADAADGKRPHQPLQRFRKRSLSGGQLRDLISQGKVSIDGAANIPDNARIVVLTPDGDLDGVMPSGAARTMSKLHRRTMSAGNLMETLSQARLSGAVKVAVAAPATADVNGRARDRQARAPDPKREHQHELQLPKPSHHDALRKRANHEARRSLSWGGNEVLVTAGGTIIDRSKTPLSHRGGASPSASPVPIMPRTPSGMMRAPSYDAGTPGFVRAVTTGGIPRSSDDIVHVMI